MNDNDLILTTGDFQCPDSGFGCVAYWNVDRGLLWVEQCFTGIWSDTERDDDTIAWCVKFGIQTASTATDANRLLLAAGSDVCCTGFDESDD
jgi:hypothetical protein